MQTTELWKLQPSIQHITVYSDLRDNSHKVMFGEAFAAELGSSGEESDTSLGDETVGVKMANLGPATKSFTVGADDEHDDEHDAVDRKVSESEEDAIFSRYVFGAVKGIY